MMKEERLWTFKEIVNEYYGNIAFSGEEKEIETVFDALDDNKILKECHDVINRNNKKIWRVGKLCIRKASCVAVLALSLFIACGFKLMIYCIEDIEVVDMNNHGEVKLELNGNADSVIPSTIEEYKKPQWIPDNYSIYTEKKDETVYSIVWESEDNSYLIFYHQYLPSDNVHYSTENGTREKVSFGKYKGEFILSEKCNYLIVTDGIYLYSLMAENIDKETMIKMMVG